MMYKKIIILKVNQWTDSYGNTYNAMYIQFIDNELEIKNQVVTDSFYGYGKQYLCEAEKWLDNAMSVDIPIHDYNYLKKNKILLVECVQQVKKKDLFTFF